jgi:hypothetical protein
MGRLDKYLKLVEFDVGNEHFAIDFKVEDRIRLAEINDQKEFVKKYQLTAEFCRILLVRSMPDEKPEAIDAYLTNNLDLFFEELLVGAKVVPREVMDRQKAELAKKVEGAQSPSPV